jgi:very-short-patch-repair endonuclease
MKFSLPKRFTKGQLELQKIIEDKVGLQTILEYQVNEYYIDIYCRECNIGFEFDGPFHSKNRDIKRDKEILDSKGIKIFRVTDLKDPELISKIMEFIDNG